MSAPDELFSPGRHEPVVEIAWTSAGAEAELHQLVDGIVAAYRGPELLWPNHPGDLDDGEPDVPLRTLYLGAGGIVWALARIERLGVAEVPLDLAGIAAALVDGWRAAPEFTEFYPSPHPSLLMGETGLLALAESFTPSRARRDRIAECVRANAYNPTRELLWGSPGTMHVALQLAEQTGEERWRALWLESAHWLTDEWHDVVWEQDLYGTHDRYVGMGHGFAGNVHALLRGRAMLEAEAADDVERRVLTVLEGLAERADGCVRWPELLGRVVEPDKLRTQWCHGAPGFVSGLGAVLGRDPAVDALLAGGGELTWRAGPLRANASLCHGTAGNGYAFLRLFARTGDEVWLGRARAFALHAALQSRSLERDSGCSRLPLFTGDAGVAVFLAACLRGDVPAFPVLDGILP